MATNNIKGLKVNSRSPGSIQNVQHHDESGSEKSIIGTPATVLEILATSTVETPLKNHDIIRVANTSGAIEYVWVGDSGSAPGTIDATNGLAIMPNSAENLYIGVSKDVKISKAVKTSSTSLQVAIMER